MRDKEPTTLAVARAYCIYGTDIFKTNEWDDSFWGDLDRISPTYAEIRWRGGVRAVRERIKRGNLGIEDSLRPWSGGYFQGLILSGALRKIHSPSIWGRYQIWENSHQALVKDLELASIGMNFEKLPGASGCRRLSRCPAISLPALDEDIVAGLFSGARIEASGDGNWMVLPASEDVKSLLARMTILFQPWKPFRDQEQIAISPFYAPLFADRMATEASKRVLAIKRPAQRTTLPLLYWECYFAKEKQPIPPFAGALPFAVSPRTFRRRRFRKSELHKTAVLEYKILALAPPLRQAMLTWYRNKSATLGKTITPQTDSVPISA